MRILFSCAVGALAHDGRSETHILQLGTRTITTSQKTALGTPVIPMWKAPMPTGNQAKAAGFPVLQDAQHCVVWKPASRDEGAYNHYAALVFHDGCFYAMWGNHKHGEDGPGQRVLYSYSNDGRAWMPPAELFPPPGPVLPASNKGIHLKPDRWAVVDGKLYAIAYVHGAGIYPIAREVAGDGALGEPFLLRDLPEKAGGVLPVFMPKPRRDAALAAKIIKWYKDNDMISWWAHSNREVPSRGVDGTRLIEPFAFRTAHGMVVLYRDFTPKEGSSRASNRIYASFADDDGGWSAPHPTDIPDSQSRAQALRLSDGRVLLAGNQIAPQFDKGIFLARDPLTLVVSPNGEFFTKVFALRSGAPDKQRFSGITGRAKGTGFGYPSMIVHDGRIYVLYSIGKEDMGISSVPLDSIKAVAPAIADNAPASRASKAPSKAEARRTEMAGALSLSHMPPVINTNPSLKYSDDARNYAMVIGMDRTPKGRLWAVWVAGGDSEDAYFVATTSDDDGRTWSAPRLVIDPPDAKNGLKRRVLVGNVWTDPLGRLWLFFDQSMGYFDGRAGSWASICENPDSDNPVWSAPQRIWHGASLNKPVVLSSGEWLLPVSLWTRDWIRSELKQKSEQFYAFGGLATTLDNMRMAHWFVSTDQGKTWTLRGSAAADERRFDEHMLVELKDGRLWMLIRTNYGLAESYSPDFGKTWGKPAPSSIKHVEKGARVFFRRLASGGILLVKHGQIDEHLKRRSHLMAFVSCDEGKTWGAGLLLDERVNVSYPDGFQAPDGSIYIIYDRERAKEREILYAKFTEEDVRQGAFKSEGSRARQLVNKARGPAAKK